METVPKGVLKSQMLAYFRKIEKTGETLIVTDHGQPVLCITPYHTKKKPQELFSALQGKVTYHEDINTPSGSEWTEL